MHNTFIVILSLLLITVFYIYKPPENEHFDATFFMFDASFSNDEALLPTSPIAVLTLTNNRKFYYRQIHKEKDTFLNFSVYQKGTYKSNVHRNNSEQVSGTLTFIPEIEGKNRARAGNYNFNGKILSVFDGKKQEYKFLAHDDIFTAQ